jgi:putative endonuclease
MPGYVYTLASRRNGTLYTGVTTDLPKRIYEHRTGLIPGFTQRYNVKLLVWFETYYDVSDAIARERRIKEWRRAWKLELIERENPDWDDLAVTLLGFDPLSQTSSHSGESRDPAPPSKLGPGVRRDD